MIFYKLEQYSLISLLGAHRHVAMDPGRVRFPQMRLVRSTTTIKGLIWLKLWHRFLNRVFKNRRQRCLVFQNKHLYFFGCNLAILLLALVPRSCQLRTHVLSLSLSLFLHRLPPFIWSSTAHGGEFGCGYPGRSTARCTEHGVRKLETPVFVSIL